jgi:hypothetical protein
MPEQHCPFVLQIWPMFSHVSQTPALMLQVDDKLQHTDAVVHAWKSGTHADASFVPVSCGVPLSVGGSGL